MPPPPPLFRGRTISAREEPQKWGTPLLALKPVGGHQFTRPPGTLALFLPPERIVSIEARGEALVCRGDFSRVDRPQVEVLSPIDADDAQQLCRALAERYGLPRQPIDLGADTRAIRTLPIHSYVTVVGTLREGHREMPNFDGVLRVRGSGDVLVDGRYRVTGFTAPGFGGDGMPPVGYSGATLVAIVMEPA
jgi:hypothetical protein